MYLSGGEESGEGFVNDDGDEDGDGNGEEEDHRGGGGGGRKEWEGEDLPAAVCSVWRRMTRAA